MKAAVRRILLLSALMSPGALQALGLGEIHLNSALNQPFDAEIELVSAAPEDLSTLRASVAPTDTFARYGLDRPAYLSEFKFSVGRNAAGADVLKISSTRPVTEPFVTMLVEASWPRGQLLREYTVLLDPPVFAPGPPAAQAPVVTPQATTAAPAPSTVTSYQPPPAPRAEPQRVRRPSIEAGTTYHVQHNDTLSQIASAAYPGTRADVNRAMLAIYQANPAAFEGNINLLHAGSDLSLPSEEQVGAISAAAARDEVARQYREWREGATGGAAGSERLRLVPPEQGTSAPSTATSAPPGAAAGTGELQDRVRQLEAELAEARRLLEVKNAELATLQGQTGALEGKVAPPAAAPPAAAPPVAETPGAEAPVPALGSEPVAEAPGETAAPAPAPAPVAEQPKPEPTAPPAAAPAEPEQPSLLSRLMGYWWVLAALLAALGAYVFLRRRREAAEEASDTFEEAFAPKAPSDFRGRPTVVGRSRDEEILVEEKRPVEPSIPKVAPAAPTTATVTTLRESEPARRPVGLEDTISSETAVNVEAGDPLAEADFHMAYGLYDQAADLVQLAIKREPQRTDLRLKLLEIYFVWGNRDRFLELAREMRQSRSGVAAGEWEKVLIMGKQIAPEDPLFAQAAASGATPVDMELTAGSALVDLEFAGDAGGESQTDIDLGEETATLAESTGIDFMLDEPARGTADPASLAPTVESAMIDPSLTEPTQEVELENLGLDVDDVQGLDDATQDLLAAQGPTQVEDTVETAFARARSGKGRGEDGKGRGEEEDTLDQTGIMRRGGGTATLPILRGDQLDEIVDVGDSTGELPTLDSTQIQPVPAAANFGHGDEPATMSEVGTKLDLARAYIDMGDPEGARSILDEVLAEGSTTQKQEAERLMASLP